MNFSLKPSLEHIALVQVVATLWNQEDIRDSLKKFRIYLPDVHVREKWLKIEAKVIEKISELSIPKSIYTEILHFIRPIGFQILRWMEFYFDGNGFNVAIPNEFCWTPQGTIDKKKNGRNLD